MAQKKELSAEEQTEFKKLWRKLVNMYHPDRFAHEPEKLETYNKLTAAINHAKSNGDLDTLRQIANDPHGYILRQGWASLDFRDKEQVSRLRKLWGKPGDGNSQRPGSDQPAARKRGVRASRVDREEAGTLDSVVVKQTGQIEAEINALKGETDQLRKEIEELTGKPTPGCLNSKAGL